MNPITGGRPDNTPAQFGDPYTDVTGCNHSATVMQSRTLVMDKCLQCGGFLVWCVNPNHEGTGARHWHYADNHTDAVRLTRGPFDRRHGTNVFGIARPPLRD